MSTDPKPPKPTPSAEEINAYLELSAARTKLRLPLAKAAARVGAASEAAAVPANEKRALPLTAAKTLPTKQELPTRDDASRPAAGEAGPGEVWRPFSSDDER